MCPCMVGVGMDEKVLLDGGSGGGGDATGGPSQ